MTDQTDPLAVPAALDARPLAAVWWLWLPLAGALGLLVFAQVVPQGYDRWLSSERGLLEPLHVVLPLVAFGLALRLLVARELRRVPLLWGWVLLGALGAFYIAGEEASWGQHYLGWSTPESWRAVNDQGETNLHNTSSWFDQKPRTLLEIAIVVGGILMPLAGLAWPRLYSLRPAVVFPTIVCLPSAVIAEGARMSERILSVLDGGTLFHRASEVQETYFYAFIVLYLVALGARIRRRERPGPAGGVA